MKEKYFKYKGMSCKVVSRKLVSFVLGMEMEYKCGYVGLNKNHSLYSVDYNEIKGIDVFGGITYSAKEEDLWWLGFDTLRISAPPLL